MFTYFFQLGLNNITVQKNKNLNVKLIFWDFKKIERWQTILSNLTPIKTPYVPQGKKDKWTSSFFAKN